MNDEKYGFFHCDIIVIEKFIFFMIYDIGFNFNGLVQKSKTLLLISKLAMEHC